MYTVEEHKFMEKIDQLLHLASKYSIKPILVLLDSFGGPNPTYGKQMEPIPRVYNSRWLQSPSLPILLNKTSQYTTIKRYIKAVVLRFGNDSRVLALDI